MSSQELNANMSIADQIKAQAGQEVIRLHTWQGIVTITTAQAQIFLDGGELIIDPLTRQVTVREDR